MIALHPKTIIQCMYAIFAVEVFISAVPEIDISPSSLLVPTGTISVFECKVRHCPHTCSVHWVINGSSTVLNQQQVLYEKQGFIFNHQHNTTSNIYMRRLAITASITVSNTELCCLVRDGSNPSRKTDKATLLVISGTILLVINKKAK